MYVTRPGVNNWHGVVLSSASINVFLVTKIFFSRLYFYVRLWWWGLGKQIRVNISDAASKCRIIWDWKYKHAQRHAFMYVHKRQSTVIPTHTDIHEHAHNSLFLFFLPLSIYLSLFLSAYPSIHLLVDRSISFFYIHTHVHTYKHTCTQVQTLTKKYIIFITRT